MFDLCSVVFFRFLREIKNIVKVFHLLHIKWRNILSFFPNLDFCTSPWTFLSKQLNMISWVADLLAGAGGDYYTTYWPQPTFVSDRMYFAHIDYGFYSLFDFKSVGDDYHSLLRKKSSKTVSEICKTLWRYFNRLCHEHFCNEIWNGFQFTHNNAQFLKAYYQQSLITASISLVVVQKC